MLNTLRNSAGSWVVKFLLGLLVISFAIWGIGSNYLTGLGGNELVKVGDREITEAELRDDFNRQVANLRARMGGQFDAEQARQMGLMSMSLQRVISRAVTEESARELGIAVPDAVVRQNISANPAFKGEDGSFDRDQFERLLYQYGFSENGFIALTRSQLTREQLNSSITAGIDKAPSGLVDTVFRHREEKRDADLVVIENQNLAKVPPPSDEQIAEYHTANAVDFTTPELRSVTYLKVEASDLAEGMEVSDEDVAARYQENLSRYVVQERRDLQQLLYSGKEEAEAAFNLLKDGKTFVDVGAETLQIEPADMALGLLTKSELPAEIADGAFGVGEGEVSTPLESPLGWHLVRTIKVLPGGTKELAEVTDELRQELQLEKAVDALFETSNQAQDAVAGGATLAETAEQIGVEARVVTKFDNRGRDANNKPVAGMLADPGFLPTVFETSVGAEPFLVDLEAGGFFMVQVDEVIPDALKPLDEVRDAVIAAWTGEELKKAAEVKAAELVEAVKGGTQLTVLASNHSGKLKKVSNVHRDGRGRDSSLSLPLVSKIFGLAEGGVATAPVPAGDAQVIAVLTAVNVPDTGAAKQAYEAIGRELANGIQSDILEQYQAAMADRIGVEVNEARLGALMSAPAQN